MAILHGGPTACGRAASRGVAAAGKEGIVTMGSGQRGGVYLHIDENGD